MSQDEQKRNDAKRSERSRTMPFLVVVLVCFVVLVLIGRDVNDVRNLSRSNRTLINRLAIDEKQLSFVAQRQIKEGTTHRRQIAASDLQLCTKLYGQIVQLERTAAAQATVAIYHHLLPSLPLPEIRNLVRNAHVQALKVERQFDPAQCSQLPSQKITKATLKP